MYTRLVVLTVSGILMASPVLAASTSNRLIDQPFPTINSALDCEQLVELTKNTAEGGDIGQKAQDEIDQQLVNLESQCAAQQFEQADQTAALIRGLIATE